MWVSCEVHDEKITKVYMKVMSAVHFIQVGLLCPAVVQCLDVLHICSGQVWAVRWRDESHTADMPLKVGLNWNEVQTYSPFNAWPDSHKSSVFAPLPSRSFYMHVCECLCVDGFVVSVLSLFLAQANEMCMCVFSLPFSKANDVCLCLHTCVRARVCA